MKGKVSVNDVLNLFVEMRYIAKVLGPGKVVERIKRTVRRHETKKARHGTVAARPRVAARKRRVG